MNPYSINTANVNKTDANSGKVNSSVNSNMVQAKASVDEQHNLRLQLAQTIPNVPNPINAKVSLNQAALLNQQNVQLSISQNAISVFLQSSISQNKVFLSPQMSHALSAFLKLNSTKPVDFKLLPKQIQDMFSQKLGQSPDQILARLMQIQLQQNTAVLSLLSGNPIAEISLGAAQQPLSDSLQSLLQFLIAIPVNDSSTLLIKENPPDGGNNSDEEGGLNFELTFKLENLGELVVKVKLQGFQLQTHCICNNASLESLVNKHWPLLQQRLNKLGFDSSNTVEFKPDVEKSEKIGNTSNLINIKV